MLNADKGTQVFVRWRSHFLSKASRWETTRPELYEDILEHVRFDPHDRQDHDFLPMLEERLDFSAYLSLCVEQGIVDAVHGTTVTWIILLVIFGIFAILTKYAHTTLMAITAYCIAMAFVVLGLMRHVSRRRQARILRHIPSSSSCSTDVGGGRVEDETRPRGPRRGARLRGDGGRAGGEAAGPAAARGQAAAAPRGQEAPRGHLGPPANADLAVPHLGRAEGGGGGGVEGPQTVW
ncbi:unnamed protein product [Prorocentrum cordatum]|uniref:Uncharacterized protein n=1 Tax=Prorocentrum cordatum TaxID=2364126 RepID=A0ABN9T578_9DINO|nr:unnamed protein product [Polarella glacialis]